MLDGRKDGSILTDGGRQFSINDISGKFEYAGIRKIKIPLSRKDLTVESIKKWLPDVMKIHKSNASKIRYFKRYADGVEQAIDNKQRPYVAMDGYNNKIKQNHAYSMVTFKEGFLLGDKREFAQKSDSNSDDLIYFDRYLSDVSFYSKDLSVKHDIYATGIGTSFVYPRADIVVQDGAVSRFRDFNEGYDIDNDSPFIYEHVNSEENAVVYTSKIGERGIGDLFCFNISCDRDENGTDRKIITVYTRDFTARFNEQYELMTPVVYMPDNYRELPMVEHSINESRIGIVEITESMLNGINMLLSTSVDNVVDVANQIIVFLGCEAKSIDVQEMYKNGAICIPPANGTQIPDVDTFQVNMKYSDINVLIQEILTRCYDIVGIPLSSSTSGSGNNQAAYVGGGWTNAMTIIKRDVRALEESDRELLKKMIAICKLNSENKVNEISANQIEIKYNVKITDNVLSYTQALQNLVDCNLPFDHILKAIPLWGDTKTVAQDWNANVQRLKAEEADAISAGDTPIEAQTVGQEANMDNP